VVLFHAVLRIRNFSVGKGILIRPFILMSIPDSFPLFQLFVMRTAKPAKDFNAIKRIYKNLKIERLR
jgi:hypothetical protein